MPNKQKCPICDNKRVDICCVLWYEANQKPKKTKKIKKQSGVIEMPNKEIVCPACKGEMKFEDFSEDFEFGMRYSCRNRVCALTAPWGRTKEEALANFKAIRFDDRAVE